MYKTVRDTHIPKIYVRKVAFESACIHLTKETKTDFLMEQNNMHPTPIEVRFDNGQTSQLHIQ